MALRKSHSASQGSLIVYWNASYNACYRRLCCQDCCMHKIAFACPLKPFLNPCRVLSIWRDCNGGYVIFYDPLSDLLSASLLPPDGIRRTLGRPRTSKRMRFWFWLITFAPSDQRIASVYVPTGACRGPFIAFTLTTTGWISPQSSTSKRQGRNCC